MDWRCGIPGRPSQFCSSPSVTIWWLLLCSQRLSQLMTELKSSLTWLQSYPWHSSPTGHTKITVTFLLAWRIPFPWVILLVMLVMHTCTVCQSTLAEDVCQYLLFFTQDSDPSLWGWARFAVHLTVWSTWELLSNADSHLLHLSQSLCEFCLNSFSGRMTNCLGLHQIERLSWV
jgi:hypothetical protein